MIKNVNDFFKWSNKHSKTDTVEAVNKARFPDILNTWTHTDVMYSFLGLYAPGVIDKNTLKREEC